MGWRWMTVFSFFVHRFISNYISWLFPIPRNLLGLTSLIRSAFRGEFHNFIHFCNEAELLIEFISHLTFTLAIDWNDTLTSKSISHISERMTESYYLKKKCISPFVFWIRDHIIDTLKSPWTPTTETIFSSNV